MTKGRLLVRSLCYYWRTNLAVLLGVVAGTAVIGGALIVGDSVRGSLREMSLARLGQIDHVLNGRRFFREALADDLAHDPQFAERFNAVAPALVMQGSLEHQTKTVTSRANQVRLFGVDDRLWTLTRHGMQSPPGEGDIVLNERVAQQLNVQPGDEVTLWVEIPASIPRDSLLGKRDQVSRAIPLTVKSILPEELGVARLNLNPNQQLPLNAFVSLGTLQSNLDLAAVPPSRRNPTGTPARVNSLFVSAKSSADGSGETASAAAHILTAMLSGREEASQYPNVGDSLRESHSARGASGPQFPASPLLTLQDLNLRLVKNTAHNYLSLETDQQILPDGIAEAGRSAADRLGLQQSPVFVYLANEFRDARNPDHLSMYSIIAGLDFDTVLQPPFGPLEYIGQPPEPPLGEGDIAKGGAGEILLDEWLAKDLQVSVGDDVFIKYYVVGAYAELPEEQRRFRVRGILKLDDTPAADRGLTPEVKGITDADTFGDWEQPFPMKLDKVTERDEQFWDQYRATPKAFVTLSAAQRLWSSRYGKLTSLRLSTLPGKTLDQTAEEFEAAFLTSLDLQQTGLAFQPVKFTQLQAASGTTDFSGLFIGFSFFLILSATILIGLLFRLGIERRTSNVGLLAAVGFAPKTVRRMFLSEGLLVVGVGGVLGVFAAIGYAEIMVYGLTTWWLGAIGTRFLDVYLTPTSLVLGFVISVAVAAGAVWWALRQLRGLSTRELLAGVSEQELTAQAQRRRGRGTLIVGIVNTALAAVLLIAALLGFVPQTEAFSGLSWYVVAFFVVGTALLVASLAFLSAWIDSDRSAAVRGHGWAGLSRLGMRNAARHRQRSVLTVGLIASATFVIVAVAAGHRNPAAEEPDKNSGNGGFTLLAESSQPILYNLNTKDGRSKLNPRFGQGANEQSLLNGMNVMPFRVKPGEEASCLNIYQTRLPTILGVPQQMIDRGGFKFVGADRDNPWMLLNDRGSVPDAEQSVPVYPVLGDMNTLQFSLHKGVGDTIPVPNADEPDYMLKIVGMFDGSVFQGALLMSEANFRELYPKQEGYRYFLIEAPSPSAHQLAQVLETRLAEFGFDAEPVAQRLADFLAVQNTYLSTFQTLGGLGLLLGTLGLATVMLRNVLERRAELALLRAVGFRNGSLAGLVMWENAFLLLWGLTAGTVSALLAMTPHLTSIGADVPWAAGGVILGSVFLIGTVAALLAVAEAVRTPILQTLRSE